MSDELIDKTLNTITDMMAQEAKSAEDAIYNSLIGLIDEELTRMQESIFAKYFLPMFSSREDYTGTPRFQQWIEIAGSAYKDVIVVNQANQELFRVPAAQSTAIVNTMGVDTDVSIKRIIDQRIADGNNNSIAAERVMINRLSNVAIFNKEEYRRANEEFIRRWNTIFSFYKLPLIEYSLTNSTNTQIDDCEDSLEYD